MKSAVITSGDHWITINTIAYLRGSITPIEPVTYNDGRQGVKISSSINPLVIAVEGSTIDGDNVGSQTELISFLRDFAYANGSGGSSGGATEQWVEDNFVRKDGIFVQNGNKTAITGDSNTQDNGAGKYSAGNFIDSIATNGYFTWFNALCYQAWGDPFNTGIGGENSTQIRGRFQTDVIDFAPNYVFIMAGTNDPRTAAGVETTIDNLKYMYDTAIAAGITVIAMSVYPARSDADRPVADQGLVDQINRWIKDYSSQNVNIHFVDNDVPLRGKPDGFRDAVHLNPTGAYRVGLNMMSVLKDIIPIQMPIPAFNDQRVVTNNPFMTGNPTAISASDVYAQGTLFPNHQRTGGTGSEKTINAVAKNDNLGFGITELSAITSINPSVAKTAAIAATSSVTAGFDGYSLLEIRIVENNVNIESSLLYSQQTAHGRVYGAMPVVSNTPWMLFKTPNRTQQSGVIYYSTIPLPSGDVSQVRRKVEVKTVAKIRLS